MSGLIKYKAGVPSGFDRDEFLSPFSNLFNEVFNEVFDEFGKDFFESGTYPKVDIRDEDSALIIDAEIPGLKKDQVAIEVDNGILRIKGEKKSTSDDKQQTYVHRELKHSTFCRSFSIGSNIDADKLTAKFENGVLEITLPKKVLTSPVEKVRKIEIQ